MELSFGMLTILATVLTWRELCVLGELTIFQSAPFPISNNPRIMARRLTCVSEDDSSALVWNPNLKNPDLYDPQEKFIDRSTIWSTIDCSFDGNDNCMKRWNLTSNWKLTDSLQKPMGPVMNKRWEDFREDYTAAGKRDYEYFAYARTDMDTYIFSIRGIISLQIHFCVTPFRSSSCYWIAIGGQNGTESFIRESMRDIEYHDGYRIPGTECHGPQDSRKHAESSLSLVEWKTLTLKYSNRSKTVTVYDDVEQILSCKFTELKTFNYIRLWSTANMLCRRHFYEYLHTTKAHEHLLSPWIDVAGSTVCIQMEIGLCAGCKASTYLISEKNHNYTMGDVMSKLNLNKDVVLPWQHVRFDKSVRNGFGKRVRFQVVTHLLKDDPSPLWAIGSIRTCKDNDAARISSIQVTQVWNEERKEYSWPEYSCQKLSYNGSSLVNSNLVIQKHDIPLCEYGKVGPHCTIDCSSISTEANCRKVSICLAEGCTCSQGWRGENCDEEGVKPEWLIGIPITAALILLILLTYYAYRKRKVIMKIID